MVNTSERIIIFSKSIAGIARFIIPPSHLESLRRPGDRPPSLSSNTVQRAYCTFSALIKLAGQVQEATGVRVNLSLDDSLGPLPAIYRQAIYRAAQEGLANKEIAHRLSLSEGAVKNYISVIFQKHNVQDRTQAALKARELGLS